MILFVDDEKLQMEGFVIELELSGYEVEFKRYVDEAWDCLVSNRQAVDLLILDIMLPAGKKFNNEENHKGLRTGVWFFDEVRAHFADLPVIIFTNVSDLRVAKKFEKEENCKFFSKPNLSEEQLVVEIKSLLGQV